MRYIRRELTITNVCDEDIKDTPTIKGILEGMLKEQSDASVMFYPKPGESPLNYERARVLIVNENSVDLQVFRGSNILRVKGIPFENFIEIKVTSSALDKYLKRNNGDRLRFLDIE